MKTLVIPLLILAGSLGAVLPDAHAYTQPASVVDSGGGVSTSTGYENLSAIGQPVVGLSTGAGGSNHAGFIPVLGANGVLWPVIGFDPATFTFTFYIGEPAPAGQGLNLTNAGGSTLEWTVARTQAWLTLTPLSGTGPSPVSVGINISAPGLVPGVYHDTITISATGAENDGVTIPVTLTVGLDYTLTVTFASSHHPGGRGHRRLQPGAAGGQRHLHRQSLRAELPLRHPGHPHRLRGRQFPLQHLVRRLHRRDVQRDHERRPGGHRHLQLRQAGPDRREQPPAGL